MRQDQRRPVSEGGRRQSALLVVTNRRAGGAHRLDDALGALRQGSPDVVTIDTSDARLQDELRGAKGRTVVAAGGDGTLNVVVQTLWRLGALADTVLGLLPLGTGNDLARTLEIPLDPSAAAEVVLSGRPRPLDLLVDDGGGVAVNAVHCGVGGLAIRHADPLKPLLGRLAYRLGAAWAGARAAGWPARVLVDEKPLFAGTALFIGIGNGRTIGGGSVLWPEARPDDGRAHVVVAVAGSTMSRVKLVRGLRSRDPGTVEGVVVGQGEKIQIDSEPIPCVADGEDCGSRAGRTWSVQPATWRLVVP